MYKLIKRMEISAAHSVKLDYDSKCTTLHGHNWIVTVYCKSETLNKDGMVEDFTNIKRKIHDKLDHQNLNMVLDVNPTAENMAKWMCDQIETAYKVEVQETEGNIAIYED
ncbi:MAG: 6-carboxytetrahydropterin synthase QueD [Bacteroidota bacterium]|nr:6-carboxytetrahydropterin synthase QueD [Bacteroidota bacterium]